MGRIKIDWIRAKWEKALALFTLEGCENLGVAEDWVMAGRNTVVVPPKQDHQPNSSQYSGLVHIPDSPTKT